MYSNDYVYGLQQQSEANYQRAVTDEQEIACLQDEISNLERDLVALSARLGDMGQPSPQRTFSERVECLDAH
jgi:uncharacterized membrane protein